ncbi:MAG: RNA polymerase sigma factor [Akkermansiaceae bacterium]
MELEDEVLVSRSQHGDTAAFECLVRRYQPRIQRFLENQISNSEDAKDMTQQTFIKAYSSLSRFRNGRHFSPWIFTIARRQSIDYLRVKGAAKNDSSRYGVEHLETDDDPGKLLASAEHCQQIWKWVRSLVDQRSYHVLWLKVQEGMQVKEISEVVGISQSNVKVLLCRARKTLVAHKIHQEEI